MKRKDDDRFLKKFPCKRFKIGICKFTNEDCKYNHDNEESEEKR